MRRALLTAARTVATYSITVNSTPTGGGVLSGTVAHKAHMDKAVTLTALVAYARPSPATSTLYPRVYNSTGTLLASGPGVGGPAGGGVVTLALTTPLILGAGTTYFFAVYETANWVGATGGAAPGPVASVPAFCTLTPDFTGLLFGSGDAFPTSTSSNAALGIGLSVTA